MPERAEETAFRRSCATGDPAAMAEVFDLTAPQLLLMAMHLARDAAEAEDLVQTTFVQAIEAAPSFDPARPLLPWLTAILANRARDLGRRRARHPPDQVAGESPSRERDPLSRALDREVANEVAHALDQMPELYRHALILRLVHGLSAVEIAHTLGRAPSTVRKQLERALALLRKALPKGLAESAALVLGPSRGLAAVRREVLSTLSRTAVPGIALAFGGTLLMKKLLLGALAVALAAFSWMARRESKLHPWGPWAQSTFACANAASGAAMRGSEPLHDASRFAVATHHF